MKARVRELTPRGRGSVSVIEVTGLGARELLASVAKRLPAPGEISVTRITAGNELLEDAVVSCTTEERLELHLTGSPPLVRKVIELLRENSALPTSCFESRAESLLAGAISEMGARILLDQVQGALRTALEAHREDAESDWKAFVLELLENARIALPAIEPKRVALAGEVNAGKSTLFNLLVGSERVIVSEQPGTTRDAVVAKAQLGEWPVVLIDTAGERDLSGADSNQNQVVIEQAGQEAGRTERERADLVLWLGDQREGAVPGEDPNRTRTLISRSDERSVDASDLEFAFSSHADPVAARALVRSEFQSFFCLPNDAWIAGRPVPIESSMCAALRDSLVSTESEEGPRRAGVFELLGPAPA